MPTSAATGTAQVTTDTAAYDRKLRYALRAPLTFVRAADVMPTNQTHPGSSVVFNLGNDFAVATTPLTELSDVSPVAGSDTSTSVTINEYGNVTAISAKLRGTAYLREMLRATNEMGYNAGLTFDTLARDPLLAGTGVDYSGAATSRVTVAATHVLTASEIRQADVKLVDANVVPFGDGLYRAYIAAAVAYDVRTETGAAAWREPHVNAGSPDAVDPIWNGSFGTFEGFNFIQTPRLAAAQLPSGFVNGGVGGTVDVYPTVFIGREALAKAWAVIDDGENGPDPVSVFSPVTDNLKRFRGVGWFWLGGFARFREAALFRWESASSIGAN